MTNAYYAAKIVTEATYKIAASKSRKYDDGVIYAKLQRVLKYIESQR